MQIHTINLIFPIGEEDVIYLKSRYSIEINEVNQFQSDYKFATFSIYKHPTGRYYLSMIIDCILLLKKIHMMDSDYFTIEQSVKLILSDMFGHEDHFKFHILKRIDYKFDAYIPDKENRKLLLNLYRKLTKSFRFQKLKDGIVKNDKEFNVYELNKDETGKIEGDDDILDEIFDYIDDDNEESKTYETTIYHVSKSVRLIAYDKEEERNAKKELTLPYEEGILRYEIAVMQKHINYRRNRRICKNSVKPNLKNYFKEKMWQEYFSSYLSPIYLNGDFYKISKAKSIINNSSERPSMKRKLIEFLTMISRGNIDTPAKKGLNSKTIKSRYNKLETLGINPILIPQNCKGAPLRLENPLKIFYK